MNKIKLLVLVCLIARNHPLAAQSGYTDAVYNGGQSISKAIEQFYISNYWALLSQQCINGDIHAGWCIDTFGNVADIIIDTSVSPIMEEALHQQPLVLECVQNALRATSGQWQPAVLDGQKIISHRFRMHVAVFFTGACKPGERPPRQQLPMTNLFRYNQRVTSVRMSVPDTTPIIPNQYLFAHFSSDTIDMLKVKYTTNNAIFDRFSKEYDTTILYHPWSNWFGTRPPYKVFAIKNHRYYKIDCILYSSRVKTVN